MMKQSVLFVLIGVLVWVAPLMATAQELDSPSPFDEEATDADESESAVPSEDAVGDGEGKDQVRKASLPLERKAKVVQKKLYPQLFNPEINAFFLLNPADSFVVTIGGGGRFALRFHEMMGFQLSGGYLKAFDRADTTLLTDSPTDNGIGINPDFIKSSALQWYAGGDFVFYPIYGKFALLSSVIAHYDAGIYVGCAAMGLENGDIMPAPDIGVFTNIYLLRWLSLRFDFVYYAGIAEDKRMLPDGTGEKGGTMVRHNYFLTFGPSFHIPVD